MLKVLVVLLTTMAVVECVIYDGTCPEREFELHKNFSCPKHFGREKSFRILAQLPTSNSSLNLYHNPMGAIDDLEVQLMCTGFEGDQRREPETIKFFMSCNDTSKSSARFSFGCNYKSLNTTTRHWDVIKYDDCQPANFWSSVHIVNYVPDLYAVLWGCRNLTNNQNEQGAWILGYKDNFSLAAKMLDQALTVDLKFAEVPTRDFVLHNQTYSGNATACSHKLCEYNLLCKNDAEDSKEIE